MIADKSCAQIKRRLAHAPEKVFAAFANAELVARWLTPSPETGSRFLRSISAKAALTASPTMSLAQPQSSWAAPIA